ncbi:MAG: protein phosphatase CheZ [Pseudomonadota bacterium]|nr:protein phosphatase CheZ [Pseudomonadota bacterium]
MAPEDVSLAAGAAVLEPGARSCARPQESGSASAVPRAPLQPADVIQHLGRLTRSLHEALSGLGFDKKIEAVAQELPDARERLAHIANLTWLAAERVLSAVEESQTLQQEVQREASSLLERWQASLEFGDRGGAFDLGEDTCAFLDRAMAVSSTQSELLQDIMMAQDFHDLTGQVIKRVGTLAQDLEKNLVQLLIETSPDGQATPPEAASAVARKPEKVHSQAEVDALLDSMGF